MINMGGENVIPVSVTGTKDSAPRWTANDYGTMQEAQGFIRRWEERLKDAQNRNNSYDIENAKKRINHLKSLLNRYESYKEAHSFGIDQSGGWNSEAFLQNANRIYAEKQAQDQMRTQYGLN